MDSTIPNFGKLPDRYIDIAVSRMQHDAPSIEGSRREWNLEVASWRMSMSRFDNRSRAAMRRVLEAIREEKKLLRLQVARLEDAEVLLKGEPAEAARKPTAARRASSRRKKRTARALPGTTSRGQSPTSDEVRDYVLSHSPTTRRQLLDALGGPPYRMDNKLKWLLSRGAIMAEGQRGARRYLAPPTQGVYVHKVGSRPPTAPCPIRPNVACTRCTTRSSTWEAQRRTNSLVA
jgi:hypothetical protein